MAKGRLGPPRGKGSSPLAGQALATHKHEGEHTAGAEQAPDYMTGAQSDSKGGGPGISDSHSHCLCPHHPGGRDKVPATSSLKQVCAFNCPLPKPHGPRWETGPGDRGRKVSWVAATLRVPRSTGVPAQGAEGSTLATSKVWGASLSPFWATSKGNCNAALGILAE